jgi:biotin carboxylase
LDALRDKVRQREMLAAAGLPTPQQLVVAVDADTDRLPRDVPLPAVLKPATGMGSVGTTRIVRYDELGPAVRATRAVVAADPRIAHLHPPLVLEEELVGDPATTRGGTRGDYVSVEAISTPRGTWVLAVQDKLPLAEPFRENGHLMPTTRPPEELADIIATARAAVAALGIEHGTTHTELKLTSAGPQVIEVNGRAGGGVCEMLALAGSYDLPLHQARAAVDPGYEPPPVVFDSYAAYLTPQPPVGRWRVAHAAGMDELAREAAVSDVPHLISVDAVVDSSDGTSSNLLRLFARAETQDELAELGARLGSTKFFTLISADNERTVR